ncbi:hypothetical protein HGRIS_001214 [Hohenbuehelia grisea]|uniref:Uncharacterized protein n=1 Tax=Hohenbuehelia grisea TaxID=104357 RepID=A0ABR3JQI2_9AGAR
MVHGKKAESLTEMMVRAQSAALRLILGTFKTTPVVDMQHLGAILPITVLLERTLDTAASAFAHSPVPHSPYCISHPPGTLCPPSSQSRLPQAIPNPSPNWNTLLPGQTSQTPSRHIWRTSPKAWQICVDVGPINQ